MTAFFDSLFSFFKNCDELLNLLSRRFTLLVLLTIGFLPMLMHIGDDTSKAELRMSRLHQPCVLSEDDYPELALHLPGRSEADRVEALERFRVFACRPAQRVQAVYMSALLESAGDSWLTMWWAVLMYGFLTLALISMLLQPFGAAVREKVDELWASFIGPFAWRLLVLSACWQLAVSGGRVGSLLVSHSYAMSLGLGQYQHIGYIALGLYGLLATLGLLTVTMILLPLLGHPATNRPSPAGA